MIRTKDELISMISQRIGEDNSDDAITLLEDISDTFTDFENKAYYFELVANRFPSQHQLYKLFFLRLFP